MCESGPIGPPPRTVSSWVCAEARAARQAACTIARLHTQATNSDSPMASQPESFSSSARFPSPTPKQLPTLSGKARVSDQSHPLTLGRPQSPTNHILCHQKTDNRLCMDAPPALYSTTQAYPQCSGSLRHTRKAAKIVELQRHLVL